MKPQPKPGYSIDLNDCVDDIAIAPGQSIKPKHQKLIEQACQEYLAKF